MIQAAPEIIPISICYNDSYLHRKDFIYKKMHKDLQDVFESEHENNRILALC